jgi:hypothetical protein
LKKSTWNDKEIEDLLSELPKLHDNRDPRDIYDNISVKLKLKRRKKWIMPSIATVSAVILFVILSTNFIYTDNVANQTTGEKSTAKESQITEKNVSKESGPTEEQEITYEQPKENNELAAKEAEDSLSISGINKELEYTAVYQEDVIDNEVLTYLIPDQQSQLTVPISLIVSNDNKKSLFELYKENMGALTESMWGLADYYPLEANLDFIEQEKELKVDVRSNHPYQNGSASEELFQKVLTEEMEYYSIEKISLYTDGKPGIVFGNKGVVTTLLQEENGNYPHYLFYPENAEKPYIVPFGEEKPSIQEALSEMKEDIESYGIKASISQSIQIDHIEESGSLLTLELDQNTEMKNDQTTLYTIEAILLTAKDYNFHSVKIENAPIDEVGKFDLDNEIMVPIAANKKMIGD